MAALRIVTLLSFALLLHSAGGAPEESITSRIRREPVSSSNVASVGYSRHLHALEIEFTRGAIYRFLDVPKSIYRELMESSSKGHYIAENLRDRFRFVRVRPEKTPLEARPAAHD